VLKLYSALKLGVPLTIRRILIPILKEQALRFAKAGLSDSAAEICEIMQN